MSIWPMVRQAVECLSRMLFEHLESTFAVSFESLFESLQMHSTANKEYPVRFSLPSHLYLCFFLSA